MPRRRKNLSGGRDAGYMRAGLFGLMQLLNPKAARAIEIQRDLKSGYYNKQRKQGDDETEAGEMMNAK